MEEEQITMTRFVLFSALKEVLMTYRSAVMETEQKQLPRLLSLVRSMESLTAANYALHYDIPVQRQVRRTLSNLQIPLPSQVASLFPGSHPNLKIPMPHWSPGRPAWTKLWAELRSEAEDAGWPCGGSAVIGSLMMLLG